MIGWVIAVGWLSATLLFARIAYGRLRMATIARYGIFDGEDQALNGMLAFCIGLVWPLMLLWLVIVVKPPKSQAELKQEAREREAYIRKLEQELDRDLRDLERRRLR